MTDAKIVLLKKEKGKLLILSALAILAVLLMVIGQNPVLLQQEQDTDVKTEEDRSQNQTEAALAEILSSMQGVGDVKVNISWEGEISRTYVFNESSSATASAEGDSENSSSRELVLDENGDPVVADAEYPLIAGVLVTAEGAENETVKKHLLDAVASYLNVGKNRIEITAMGN